MLYTLQAPSREVNKEMLPSLGLRDRVKRLVEDCRQALSIVLPFTKDEREFLNRILDYGEIDPSLLTSNKDMGTRIRNHPGLQWKALNVREFKGLKES